ncbi:hypothetical protein [Clostridium lundense]|uniref:hypothetical protein n=1 Tax=Clostridium lundense TaxID=319475 RepID=UPI00047FEA75|nr:hypothetical protein [Clostridium lundense]
MNIRIESLYKLFKLKKEREIKNTTYLSYVYTPILILLIIFTFINKAEDKITLKGWLILTIFLFVLYVLNYFSSRYYFIKYKSDLVQYSVGFKELLMVSIIWVLKSNIFKINMLLLLVFQLSMTRNIIMSFALSVFLTIIFEGILYGILLLINLFRIKTPW